MIGQKFGRYEILSEIGRGGMAQVYLADDPRFRRKVAIKILPTQFLQSPILRTRFEREARTIAALEHPAIVPVYDYGEQDEQLFLVMRYMPGGSLSNLIKKGPIPLNETIRIFSQIAPALEAVHMQGTVHRDIKPANILFDGFGNAALSDFGIVQLSQATVELTGSAVIGTPSYMSPEQVRADSEIDGRSDLYALGVVLFEMLTGRQPYHSTTPMATALKHLSDPIPNIRIVRADLPDEIEAIIQKSLAKNREDRYSSALEIMVDLKKLENRLPAEQEYKVKQDRPSSDTDTTQRDDEEPLNSLRLESASNDKSPSRIEADLLQSNEPPATPLEKQQPQTYGVNSLPGGRIPAITQNNPQASSSRRRGMVIWGVGGAASVVGLCLFLLAGGLIVWLVLKPKLNPGVTSLSSSTDTQSETPLESPSTTPVIAQKPILFADDFSLPGNGWPVVKEFGGEFSYADGGYRVFVNEVDSVFWASPDQHFENVSVSAKASKISGSDSSYYGLICRETDPDHYYYFVIWGDGRYTIGKHKDGEFTALVEGGSSTSDLIHQGNATNQLRADCSGQTLGLFINGTRVVQVSDTEFTSGKVGVAVAALDDQGMEVVFDNFVVSEPDN